MRPLEEGHLLLAGSYVNGATLDVRYADPRALPLRFATVRLAERSAASWAAIVRIGSWRFRGGGE